jgi:hypothetical protein
MTGKASGIVEIYVSANLFPLEWHQQHETFGLRGGPTAEHLNAARIYSRQRRRR